MKYLTVLLASIVLTSCSSFEFKTNLDPQNFKEYFKPSYVTEVDEDDLARMNYYKNKRCPYYKIGDEYTIVRKQN